MRQHKLALCQEHYLQWFIQQTERAIRKYHMFPKDARLLVAVSGGKDSLSLWDVLWRLGYVADGIYIQLGIDDLHYSEESGVYAEQFAVQRDLKLHKVSIKERYGRSVLEFSRGATKKGARPCAKCGLIKRYIMNQTALENEYSVLVTGHNLDDEVAVLLGNTLRWDTDLLPRQAPVLPQREGFIRKAKPFCRFYERETAAYALLQGIAYMYDECPYAKGSKSIFYKNLLNQLEDQVTGSKLAFYQNFLNAKKQAFLSRQTEEGSVVNKCVHCGQPTTKERCAFCRMILND
jgi:uncharacterized protein (TIGR00269 family)